MLVKLNQHESITVQLNHIETSESIHISCFDGKKLSLRQFPSCMSKKFECFTCKKVDEELISSNGGFHHPTKNMTLYIAKDGANIQLHENEIKQLTKTIEANFKC